MLVGSGSTRSPQARPGSGEIRRFWQAGPLGALCGGHRPGWRQRRLCPARWKAMTAPSAAQINGTVTNAANSTPPVSATSRARPSTRRRRHPRFRSAGNRRRRRRGGRPGRLEPWRVAGGGWRVAGGGWRGACTHVPQRRAAAYDGASPCGGHLLCSPGCAPRGRVTPLVGCRQRCHHGGGSPFSQPGGGPRVRHGRGLRTGPQGPHSRSRGTGRHGLGRPARCGSAGPRLGPARRPQRNLPGQW